MSIIFCNRNSLNISLQHIIVKLLNYYVFYHMMLSNHVNYMTLTKSVYSFLLCASGISLCFIWLNIISNSWVQHITAVWYIYLSLNCVIIVSVSMYFFYWNASNLCIKNVPFISCIMIIQINSYQKFEKEGHMIYPGSWENDYSFKHLPYACHVWWFILSVLWNAEWLISRSPSSDGTLWTPCLK